MPITPQTAYRVGLVAQTLTDASPRGLTLAGLRRRTKLPEVTLVGVLRVCVRGRGARQKGERYYADA